jgi:hypothetical protein
MMRIFATQRERENRKKLDHEKLHDFYFSPNILTIITGYEK